MDIKEIIEIILNILDKLISTIPFISDVCLLFISIYTFRLTIYPKKLKFIGFAYHGGLFDGDWFEIILENRCLCPIVVTNISLLVDSYCIEVFKNGNCIIDSFKTATIKVEPYSDIYSDDEYDFSFMPLKVNSMTLKIETSRGCYYTKYVKTSRISQYFYNKKHDKFKIATIIKHKYNDKIVKSNVKYALSFTDSDKNIKTILIANSGAMSENLFGYNVLPKELIEDELKLKKHFDKEFAKYNTKYTLEPLHHPFNEK